MAEFIRNDVQTVNPGSPVVLDTAIGCNKGYVYHRPQSGIVTLRGITTGCFARYQVIFSANIALAEGATVGPISVALTIDGEPLLTSTSISNPAATGEYNKATCIAIITVPKGCCWNISVENTSVGAATNPPIDVQNATLVVSRVRMA